MKNKLQLVLIAMIIMGFSACEKKQTTVECQLIQVVRLRSDCDRIIFKVISENRIGDANWTDNSTGQTHTNVVAMINPCRFNSLPYPEMQRRDTFFVKIQQLPNSSLPIVGENCVQCLALSNNPPTAKVDFLIIDTSTCEF
jgi:hypothetical protein